MRVMVIIKANKESEAGVLPDEKLLTEMGEFNEELVKAGVMAAGEGLHPSSKGKRVRFSGAKRTVIDGPFAETKELIAGFWLWKVKSLEEAIEYLPVFLITVGQTQVFHRSPQFVVGYPQIAQIRQIKRRT
ncbi:MAG: YciI family protein [Pyrinomonadaceae bacterium]|nr:YciI family protein [Pyrinomonadaceae bacterium]